MNGQSSLCHECKTNPRKLKCVGKNQPVACTKIGAPVHILCGLDVMYGLSS